MIADAVGSAGVVAAGIIVMLTGMNWIDPVSSIVIVLVIVAGTWGLFSGFAGTGAQCRARHDRSRCGYRSAMQP